MRAMQAPGGKRADPLPLSFLSTLEPIVPVKNVSRVQYRKKVEKFRWNMKREPRKQKLNL